MSKQPANAIRVYLDEFDVSGVLNSTNLAVQPNTPAVTSFSDTGPRRVLGPYDYDTSHLGFFEGDSGLYDENMHALLSATGEHYLTQLFEGATENTIAYDSLIHVTGQPRSAQFEGAVLLNFDGAGQKGLTRGLVLGAVTTTGAENRTGRNQGTTASGTTYAVVFRVLTFSGTNITLKIQESSDDGSGDAYGDVSGLTSGALSAVGVVRATTTSATEAWKRLNISGTFTSCLILVTAGVVAGT